MPFDSYTLARRFPAMVSTLLVLVPLTLAACVAGLGWFSWQTPTTDGLAAARGAAVAAARPAATAILSYDYRTLGKDFAAGRKVSTDPFLPQYQKTTAKVRPTAKKYHVTVTAQVAAAAVVSGGEDRVEVLLFVDQNTVSDLVENGRLDQNRVLMTMADVDGRWLVADVDAL